MKTKLLTLLTAMLLLCVASFIVPTTAVAQAADSTALIQPDTAAAIATPFIVTLAMKAPWVLTVLAVMGGFRFFFKPVVSLVEAYVRSTPQKTDDEFFDRAQHSRTFKIVAWLLDFFASVKVGPQFTAKPEVKA